MTATFDSRTVAVLDTNVMVELYSCHNIARESEPEKIADRLTRARHTLLAAIFLDQTASTTTSISELAWVLRDRLNPSESGSRSLEEQMFIRAFLYFVKDFLLPRWKAEVEACSLWGNLADQYLLDMARSKYLPLVTRDEKLASRAKSQGVTVCKPGDLWKERMDSREAASVFLTRFKEQAPAFVRSLPQQVQRDRWARLLDEVYPVYRFLLLGR